MSLNWPQMQHWNVEVVFLPRSMFLHHQIHRIHIVHRSLHHLIYASDVLYTVTFYQAESYSLLYSPLPSLFWHQILHCCHIICNTPYVISTIEAPPLMSLSSQQWDRLTFSMSCSALLLSQLYPIFCLQTYRIISMSTSLYLRPCDSLGLLYTIQYATHIFISHHHPHASHYCINLLCPSTTS